MAWVQTYLTIRPGGEFGKRTLVGGQIGAAEARKRQDAADFTRLASFSADGRVAVMAVTDEPTSPERATTVHKKLNGLFSARTKAAMRADSPGNPATK